MPKRSASASPTAAPTAPTAPATPLPYVIGIDVCKAALDCNSATSRRQWQIPNEPRAIASFLQALPPQAHLFVEATGRYEEALVRAAHQAGVTIFVINPLWVRRFAESRGYLLKTDRADAKCLRLYGESTPSRPTLPVPPELHTLTTFTTLREQLVKIQTQLLNSTEHLTEKAGLRILRALLKTTAQQIARLEEKARTLIAQTPALAARSCLLLKQYGIGEVTATNLLCWLPELGSLNRQQIAHLAGLAPQANESGRRQGKRRLRGGRPQVRRALYLATLTAVRQPGSFLQGFYQRLCHAGKLPKVARLAAARKFLTYLNSLLQKHPLPPLLPTLSPTS
jgi:transposase